MGRRSLPGEEGTRGQRSGPRPRRSDACSPGSECARRLIVLQADTRVSKRDVTRQSFAVPASHSGNVKHFGRQSPARCPDRTSGGLSLDPYGLQLSKCARPFHHKTITGEAAGCEFFQPVGRQSRKHHGPRPSRLSVAKSTKLMRADLECPIEPTGPCPPDHEQSDWCLRILGRHRNGHVPSPEPE